MSVPSTKVVETVRATGARSLVTILTAGAASARPSEIEPPRHLRLSVSDIDVATEGHVLAGARSMSSGCSPFCMTGIAPRRW